MRNRFFKPFVIKGFQQVIQGMGGKGIQGVLVKGRYKNDLRQIRPADLRQYRRASQTFWNLREAVATAVALWEIHLSQPKPILGNPEPIFPLEAQ